MRFFPEYVTHIYSAETLQPLCILDCLQDLVTQYNEAKITLDSKNAFQISYAPVFIESILENFLTRHLEPIQKEDKGQIKIWFSQEKEFNILHLQAIGSGLSDHALTCIFDHFFSKNKGKVTPGWGLCRLALLYIGGNVLCESQEGKSTCFKVFFPKLWGHSPLEQSRDLEGS